MDFVISPYWFISYSRFCNRLLLFSLLIGEAALILVKELQDVSTIHGAPVSSAVGEILFYQL